MAARVSPWWKRCTARPVRERRWYSTSRKVCLTHSNVKVAPAVHTRWARWRLVPRAAARASLARLGPALALLLVVAVFALLTDAPARYLSPFNLRIVLSQTVIVALGAIGMTLIMISGGIDLSRSEERRVGKECRSVWTAYVSNKKVTGQEVARADSTTLRRGHLELG